MGCIASKNAVTVTPAVDSSGILRERYQIANQQLTSSVRSLSNGLEKKEGSHSRNVELEEAVATASAVAVASRSARMRSLRRSLEGEQVAAGWPPWLSAVAGEAIQGWIPLKADSFEKLEKVGQGTYSSVFRARNLDTGRIVALKKVRFDNFEPESVRFMAREIQILRRLDHPNVMKLEGLITSRLSCSLYLVFEYMEHDLAGLSSNPDIRFSESQVKCYMQQLLSGLEHCHSHGVVHRDIKGANLLINDDGVLKMADFGLANFFNPEKKCPLTSRVVTLWYRPPELLLGSTSYDASVDLWSVGCVFAEMFRGKPILQGRTEVEQLHKIFKLCGSPPDEYWKRSKLPHATIFKPHHPYPSNLQETFKDIPGSALALLETLLSVESYKRGSASTALVSEYFHTKPYACEPASLPKYPPCKEMDAKMREDSHRKKGSRERGPDGTRKSSRLYRAARENNGSQKTADETDEKKFNPTEALKDSLKLYRPRVNGDSKHLPDLEPSAAAAHRKDVARHLEDSSVEEGAFSGPLIVSSSSNFDWAKKRKEDLAFVRSRRRSGSKGQMPTIINHDKKREPKIIIDTTKDADGDASTSHMQAHHDATIRSSLRKWSQLDRQDSFGSCDTLQSQDFRNPLYIGNATSSGNSVPVGDGKSEGHEYSGPLMLQSHKIDELLQRHERRIRQAVRKSWFRRGRKLNK